jgi:hypothetical protein
VDATGYYILEQRIAGTRKMAPEFHPTPLRQSAVRGGSYNVIFRDEFAFIPNHIADGFFASVYPTISSGQSTKVIIVSTPRGMNHFYRMWHDAERGKNEYIPTDVHLVRKFLGEIRRGKSRRLLSNT